MSKKQQCRRELLLNYFQFPKAVVMNQSHIAFNALQNGKDKGRLKTFADNV